MAGSSSRGAVKIRISIGMARDEVFVKILAGAIYGERSRQNLSFLYWFPSVTTGPHICDIMQVTSLSLPPLQFQVVQAKIKDKSQKRKSKHSSSYGVPRKPRKGTLPVKHSQNAIKPFSEEDVFPSSLPLHTRNPHAIYKDIQRFARQNKLKEALIILDYMDRQGIPINVTTFSSLIAACVRSKSLAEGKQIHTHIKINGLESNEFLRTKLVHMFTSCGSIEDAKMIFNTCCSKTVYPYNALIRGAVISGRRRYLDVISTFSEMREIGIECNEYTFSSMIKSFAGASALRQGLRTHALLIKNGLIDTSLLRTSLIDMYFKCGKVKLACQVFEEIDERDIVAWGAMIAGFAHNRLQMEAIEYTKIMISEGTTPNSVILTTILPVIGVLRARRLGQEVHAYVLKTRSYSKQLSIQSGLIDMYCKCGDMGSGRQVFYGSSERNAISWTALISGYISNGRLEQALRSIVWMQQEGCRPDIVTIATVLPVCSQLKDLKHGKEIHAYATKNGFAENVSVITSLIVMYSKCRILNYSFKLFEGMPQRNVISWTAMIDSCAESGFLYEALDIFRAMQFSKHRPDSVALARLLNVCGRLRDLKLGKEVHGQVLKKNFGTIPFVSSEIMKMYGSCQSVLTAKSVFSSIPVRGSMTWTAIIEAYGINHMYRDAINLFDQMICEGFTPNEFTFRTVLEICNQAGFADDAYRIFNQISVDSNMRASGEFCSLVIGLLEREGHFEESQKLKWLSTSLS